MEKNTKPITIQVRHKEPMEVVPDHIIDDYFAVMRALSCEFTFTGPWHVTHIPSGLRIPYFFEDKETAITFALELKTLPLNWASTEKMERDAGIPVKELAEKFGGYWL